MTTEEAVQRGATEAATAMGWEVRALTSLERGGGHYAMFFDVLGVDGQPVEDLDNALVVVPEDGGPVRFVQGFEEWMGALEPVVLG